MWANLLDKISRLLHGQNVSGGQLERLAEAQAKLDEEADALQRDVGRFRNRVDPVGDVIRNIKQVRDRK